MPILTTLKGTQESSKARGPLPPSVYQDINVIRNKVEIEGRRRKNNMEK